MYHLITESASAETPKNTYLHLINNFLLYINLDSGEQRHNPSKQAKQTPQRKAAFTLYSL